MKTIRSYIESLLALWSSSNPTARIGMLVLLGTCAVAVAGVGYWSIQPSYVILLSEQDGNKMDLVINALDKEGISYQLSGAGGNLMVDKRYFAKARLLARNIGVDTAEGGGAASGMMGAFISPEERRELSQQQKEARLATSIEKMSAIEGADVHLVIPKRSPFVRTGGKPSASVLLTLRTDDYLTDKQAGAIANLVAFAVEGLQPEAVQISDKNGHSYTVADSEAKEISTQVEYVSFAERKLEDKAMAQLSRLLGPGNASVMVSLDMSFSKGSRTTTKYEAANKVATEENLESTTTKGSGTSGGPAGVASNLQTRAGGGEDDVISKTENIQSSYLVPKTEETESDSTPTKNYMTVSVIVNDAADGVKDEQSNVPAALKTQLEDVVKNAVGFRDTGLTPDTISLAFHPFPELTAEVPVAAPFEWGNIITIMEYVALIIAAGLAFAMGMMLLRRIRPPEQAEQTGASRVERLGSVQQLSEMIEENPEVFTRLVRLWSGELQTLQNEQEDDSQNRAARAA